MRNEQVELIKHPIKMTGTYVNFLNLQEHLQITNYTILDDYMT